MMANRLFDSAEPSGALIARLGELDVASHGHVRALASGSGPEAARDLADFVHLLCGLHGTHPGLLGHSRLLACHDPAASEWLRVAADSFEPERAYLIQLTAAVGPLPSTPGAAESEAALGAQRNALE